MHIQVSYSLSPKSLSLVGTTNNFALCLPINTAQPVVPVNLDNVAPVRATVIMCVFPPKRPLNGPKPAFVLYGTFATMKKFGHIFRSRQNFKPSWAQPLLRHHRPKPTLRLRAPDPNILGSLPPLRIFVFRSQTRTSPSPPFQQLSLLHWPRVPRPPEISSSIPSTNLTLKTLVWFAFW